MYGMLQDWNMILQSWVALEFTKIASWMISNLHPESFSCRAKICVEVLIFMVLFAYDVLLIMCHVGIVTAIQRVGCAGGQQQKTVGDSLLKISAISSFRTDLQPPLHLPFKPSFLHFTTAFRNNFRNNLAGSPHVLLSVTSFLPPVSK